MPTYEYQCFSCNLVFEEFQRMSDDPIKICPKCGAENVKRLIAATAFHLKGSGWYKTDYASGSKGAAGSESSGDGESAASATPSGADKGENAAGSTGASSGDSSGGSAGSSDSGESATPKPSTPTGGAE